ncbi:hydroxymethylglutaryl-CoA synthase family protein [Rhizorhabdus dicambivorans]|uniref:3-hydroxy-3-methylglutaryl CoA synthase n=1 Tax=Rhizorhabdus dicambivorans TaxID=1850238 RepID=A0A2A4FPA5_9SPHN|nr:OB-fold domain-containing protein [Rhizorhabdus dicambivorans]ATE64701.1 3-hydroxy-3-methylglutaryl CoA synthase [Rhizorhabdus dicambivorans]PCE39997.1 3-hydroxy-3-methylglutaryl CoA synthase [Rhizorhabdus dicambivorans]
MPGILAFGAYVPRLRLQRSAVVGAHSWFNPGLKGLGAGERSMCAWDEDTITMGVEASRDCLNGIDRTCVAKVVLASTSHPFSDRQNSVVLKEALNLPDTVGAIDVSGSQRAATSALLDGLHAVAGGAGETLCVASEKRRARPGSELELIAGDGAAALLLGPGDGVAAFVGAASTAVDFVDHFRAAGADADYDWESRWIRDEGYARIIPKTVAEALARAGLEASDVDHFVMGAPMKGVNAVVAKSCGMRSEAVCDPLASVMGEAGTAQPLILLARALETAAAGEIILVVGFGQGCDALLFRATGKADQPPAMGVSGWIARRAMETNYFKYLTFNGHLLLERGMRAEFDQKTALTALYRNRKAVLALVGGRCTETGTVQFPKSAVSVAQDVRAVLTQEDYPLAERRARVLTYTADRLTFTPDPPAYYGAVTFDGGGRITMDFADVDEAGVEVGMPMRMMFRVKAVDQTRQFTKYFWKAVPDYLPADADLGRGEN